MDANATHSDRVALYLTGRRAEGLREVGALRPALQARYRDLSSLRHDFPLVLASMGDPAAPSLKALVDAALASIAKGADAERTRRQVLRVEQEVRVLLQQGVEGTLGKLWGDAVERLAPGRDASFAEAARRARAAIAVEGPLLRCDAALPERLLQHVWQQAQRRKEAALRERLVRLIQQLSDILRADFEHSGAGRNATRLKASVGSGHSGLFDFEAMSRVLAHAIPRQPMPEARRERIRRLLGVLDAQPFVALPDESAARVAGNEAYGYRFDSCAAALAAWNERLPRLVELARAIEVAELEIDGRYHPERHDALFESYGANGLEPDMLSRFPDVLVCLDGTSLDAAEQTRLMEILAGELPIKVLYRVDDLLAAPDDVSAPTSPGLRCRQIAHMAMGLNQVYVLHAAASHLPRCGERIGDAMRFAGPALFCIYSGASTAAAGQSTYLAAAAAMESRAFPAFVYDPVGWPRLGVALPPRRQPAAGARLADPPLRVRRRAPSARERGPGVHLRRLRRRRCALRLALGAAALRVRRERSRPDRRDAAARRGSAARAHPLRAHDRRARPPAHGPRRRADAAQGPALARDVA
jgi:hypothetical protein